MVDVDNVFFKTVAPCLGMIIANIMFLSPFKAVIQVSKDRELGDLNPVPFPLIFGNCAGWVAYSYATRDPWVYFSNLFGFLLGMFYTVTSYGYATQQMRKFLLSALVVFCGVVAIVGFVGIYAELGQQAMRTLWGLTANIILVLFYSAPLSAVWNVLRTRNSRLLHWPLAAASLVNGTLWVFYGLAMDDGYIWIPNLIGAILGAFQLLLIFLFPAKKVRGATPDAEHVEGGSGDCHPHTHKDGTLQEQDVEKAPTSASFTTTQCGLAVDDTPFVVDGQGPSASQTPRSSLERVTVARSSSSTLSTLNSTAPLASIVHTSTLGSS